MPSTLAVSRYKRFSNASDIGHVASFRLRGKELSGLVLQYVKHRTCFADEPTKTRRFTEAWRVDRGKIAHGGKDYFLIPRQYHQSSGTVSLSAHAWFVKGDPDELLKALGMADKGVNASPVSGMLPSEKGKVPEKYRRSTGVRRNWCVSWSKQPAAKGFKVDQSVHWRD